MDNMARIPLVVDAASHVFARNRRHTLHGDSRNFYDHNIAVANKLLMEVTGVMICKPPSKIETLADEQGRPRLPRPHPSSMCAFLRGVPNLAKGCTQYMHWCDIEEAYLSMPPDDRPEYLFVSVDNGSGFEPTDEIGWYYACKFLQTYRLKLCAPLSYASGQSALNYLIERPWSQFKKAIVGQRFGQAFLGGRRAPLRTEMAPFFQACTQEMKDIFEANVTVSRGAEEITTPSIRYVEPLLHETVMTIQTVRNFFLCTSKKVAIREENDAMREFARYWNTRTHQTLNGYMVYSKNFRKADFFGACNNLPQPEEWCAPDGSRHFATYLQLKEKYKDAAQDGVKLPPVQGREALAFGGRTFRFQSQAIRHKQIMHGQHTVQPNRKRPQPKGFARRGLAKRRRTEEERDVWEEEEEHAQDVREEEEEHVRDIQEEDEGEEEEEEEDCEVERIVGVKLIRGVLHYVVRWKGWGEKDDTALPRESLHMCEELIDEFEERERDRNLSRSLSLGLIQTFGAR